MSQHRRDRGDEGFTLIEVVVSMLIFAVLSSAVVGLLVKTLQTTTRADNKSAAANLADSTKEYLIGAPWTSVVSGSDLVDADGTPWTSSAQGVAYTVKTTVSLVPNSDSFCSTNGAELTRKLIVVGVSWPGMGSSDAVQNQTFRRIYQADTATTPGSAAWQVNTPSFSGNGVVTYAGLGGITATAYDSSGSLVGTGTTDSTGCVVVSNLDAGTYSLVIDQGGYLGQDNQQRQVTNVTVQAGKISVPEALRYAPASSAKLTLATVAGYDLPTSSGGLPGLGTTFYADVNSGYDSRAACSASASPSTTACLAADGTVGRLYPKAYSGYLGACADVKATATDFTPRWTAPDVPTVPVQLGALQYRVTTLLSSSTWTVTATHASGASCTGQTIPLGTTQGNTTAKVGLPLGTWTVTATNGVTNYSKVVTVTATAPAVPTNLGTSL